MKIALSLLRKKGELKNWKTENGSTEWFDYSDSEYSSASTIHTHDYCSPIYCKWVCKATNERQFSKASKRSKTCVTVRIKFRLCFATLIRKNREVSKRVWHSSWKVANWSWVTSAFSIQPSIESWARSEALTWSPDNLIKWPRSLPHFPYRYSLFQRKRSKLLGKKREKENPPKSRNISRGILSHHYEFPLLNLWYQSWRRESQKSIIFLWRGS